MSRHLKPKPQTLTGIGYWHSIHEPHFPDPGAFVDETWDPQVRARIIHYLQSGIILAAAGGHSWCRFRCGIRHTGSAIVTDGIYLWPEGLTHYIAEHNVRLPHEVVDTMLSNQNISPPQNEISSDWTWWQSQKGWNTTITDASLP